MNDESVTRLIPFDRDDGASRGDCPAEVVVLAGVARGTRLGLREKEVRIGRRADNDLVLESPSVSKYHARILCEGGCFVIEDLGSTNGVRVNGTALPAKGRRNLSHGDNIMVSDQLLLFHLAGTFTDAEGLSTISFDPSRVKEDVDRLLGDLPGLDEFVRRRQNRPPPTPGPPPRPEGDAGDDGLRI